MIDQKVIGSYTPAFY